MPDEPPSATNASSPNGRGGWSFRFSAASSSTTATAVGNLLTRYSSIADDDWNSDLSSQNGLEVGSDSYDVSSVIHLSSPPFPPRYSAIHPITLAPPAESSSYHDYAEAGMQSYHQYI